MFLETFQDVGGNETHGAGGIWSEGYTKTDFSESWCDFVDCGLDVGILFEDTDR